MSTLFSPCTAVEDCCLIFKLNQLSVAHSAALPIIYINIPG